MRQVLAAAARRSEARPTPHWRSLQPLLATSRDAPALRALPLNPPRAPRAAHHINPRRQIKDKWGFRMTARYDMYAKLLGDYVKHDYRPQVVKDPSL